MLLAVLVVLWGTGGVLSATEVRAGRPEVDLQDGNHLVLVLERLDQLERTFGEEKRQWQTEKKDWQKEKQEWQKEKQDWQKERREWQRQIGQSESLTRQMQRHIISMQYKAHVLETGANTRKSTTPRTPLVFSQGTISSKKLRKTSQKRHDRHVLARSDDVNPLEFVVSQMGQRLRQVTAEVQSVKNALEQDVNKMGQNINEVTAEVQSLKNVLQMSQNLSKVAAEVQSLKNILESEVSKMSQNLSDVTREVQSLKNILEPEVNQMGQNLSEVTAEVQSLKNTLEPEVNQMSQNLSDVTAEVQSLKNLNSQQDQAIQQAGTSTFVRWGRSVCPSSTELVYSGVAGGAWYDDSGSTTTAFCLPLNPVLGTEVNMPSQYDWMCGAEYQTEHHHFRMDTLCAVCRTPRPTTIMVPATNVCEDGWTLEYSGYVMGSTPDNPASHEAVCMDSAFESRPGTSANDDGFLFFLMFTYCGSLPCPPYQSNKVVTCAVCSK